MTLDDLPSLMECVSGVYDQPGSPIGGGWSEAQLREEIKQGKSFAGIYQPFGVACFILWYPLPEAFEVRLLATHPQWQRRGLMARLLRSVIELVPAGQELWLEVHAENMGARNLYEKLGFSVPSLRTSPKH